jgi:hypothetical protein
MADEEVPKRDGTPKWLRDEGEKGARTKRSRKHETRVAKAFGGRRVAASGAKPFSRWNPKAEVVTAGGDVATPDFLIEHKFVERGTKSLGVTRAWLEKVTEGAKRSQKEPAMVLTFEHAAGHAQDWLLIPMDVARRLLGVEDTDV